MIGSTVALDIRGRRDGQYWRFNKLSCNEGREARLSEAYREVCPFGYQVSKTFTRHELDIKFWEALAELSEPSSQNHRQEERVDVDLESPTNCRHST